MDNPKWYCRNCKAIDWLHKPLYNQVCPCKEFVPGDNLDYIEWLYAKENRNVDK